VAHSRKNASVRKEPVMQSITMPEKESNDNDEMQLATNAKVEPTHFSLFLAMVYKMLIPQAMCHLLLWFIIVIQSC